MQRNKVTYLWSVLEEMPTKQLEEILQEELQNDQPNEKIVRLILKILQNREDDDPVEVKPKAEVAWKKYLDGIAEPLPEVPTKGKWLPRVAAAAAIFILLIMVLPQDAAAQNFFERLISWTDSIFALINPEDADNVADEYVFHTDNPGLQQVYDTVVELGVTQPVVPMWLPVGFELVECKVVEMPTKKIVGAIFSDSVSEASLTVTIYSGNVTCKYYKDSSEIHEIEFIGATHKVTKNDEYRISVWTKDNIECAIFADCQEDTFIKILRSIYIMEDE